MSSSNSPLARLAKYAAGVKLTNLLAFNNSERWLLAENAADWHIDDALIMDRYEIASTSFNSLRRNIRQILLKLYDAGGEAEETSKRLWELLCEWLTVPVPLKKASAL